MHMLVNNCLINEKNKTQKDNACHTDTNASLAQPFKNLGVIESFRNYNVSSAEVANGCIGEFSNIYHISNLIA